jgi:hypothetical protein
MENWIVYGNTAMHKVYPWLVVEKTYILENELSVSFPQETLARLETEIGKSKVMDYFCSAREAFLASETK